MFIPVLRSLRRRSGEWPNLARDRPATHRPRQSSPATSQHREPAMRWPCAGHRSFEPGCDARPRARAPHPVRRGCNLCNAWVRFVVWRDPTAAQQARTGQAISKRDTKFLSRCCSGAGLAKNRNFTILRRRRSRQQPRKLSFGRAFRQRVAWHEKCCLCLRRSAERRR
jgi:hypothetical protein